MPLFSSISSALERIHIPNVNLDFNSSISHLDPILQGHYISATTVATVAAVLAASYHILYNVYEIQRPKGYRDIPQISSWRMIYYTIFSEMHVFERYDKVMRKVMEKQGIARVNMFGRSFVHLAAPEYARQLLLHTHTFKKDLPTEQFPNSILSRLFGENIVFSNNEEWKHHRKVCNPAFHKSWPTDVFGDCTNCMMQLIASETKNGEKSLDVTDLLKRLTLDALGKAVFDFNFNAIENPNGEHVTAYHQVMYNAFNPLYILFPWLDNIPFLRRNKLLNATNEFNRLIFKLIDEKRQKLHDATKQGIEPENKDLLSMMIQANESEEDTLTTEELRADVIIFFLAGHDTTANALASSLYHLSRRPDLQEKIHAEVTNIIGPATASNSTPIPTLDQVKDMQLIEAVMKEAMRMYPSAPALIPRKVSNNTPVGPYIVPPGVGIQLNIYGVHRNPKYWDNPDEFRPERFLPDADGNMEKRDPNAWIPFSYGSRSCIGMNFSLIEQRVVLSMIIHRFKFTLPADSPHKDAPKFNPRGVTSITKLKLEFTPRY